MYPRINELIRTLHSHNISTFLVTNAQFPEAIRSIAINSVLSVAKIRLGTDLSYVCSVSHQPLHGFMSVIIVFIGT